MWNSHTELEITIQLHAGLLATASQQPKQSLLCRLHSEHEPVAQNDDQDLTRRCLTLWNSETLQAIIRIKHTQENSMEEANVTICHVLPQAVGTAPCILEHYNL